MPSDFQKKTPTKNEEMFREVAMQIYDLDKCVWSISSHMLALGVALKIDSKRMAEILTGDEEKIREYAKQINEEIKKIEDARPKDQNSEHGSHVGHDHSGHNHSH